MDKVYFISGLGADRRVFALLDLSWCDPVFIDWIKPEPTEDLATYALRLGKEIAEPDAKIVGLSLGGMLATEIAKDRPQAKVVLVSSNKLGSELPTYMKMFRFMPIYKLMPSGFMRRFQKAYTRTFGVKGVEAKQLMYQVIADADFQFVRWGIGAIMNWKNDVVPPNVIHIHGTKDRTLPYRLVKPDYTVHNGGHVMTMDSAEAVGSLLKEILAVG